MTTLAPTLPPPLTAPPSVATLQGLLDGLQQPMQRGVPSPPAAHADRVAGASNGDVVDITRLERVVPRPDERAAQLWGETVPPVAAPAPVDYRHVAAVPSPADVDGRPGAHDPDAPRAPLTWSAGRSRAHPRRTAVVVATAAAVGVLTALAAAGELGLP